MRINTTRFGSIEISDEDILAMPEGLLGFADCRRFVLLDDPSDDIFAWLQSCDFPEIAFPVLEPELLAQNFSLQLTKSDYEALQTQESECKTLRSFLIVTIPDDPKLMTANFKAPIVINIAKRIVRQCVLQDNHLAIREPIFLRLQQRFVQHPNQSVKSQNIHDLDMVVRLPEIGGSELESSR